MKSNILVEIDVAPLCNFIDVDATVLTARNVLHFFLNGFDQGISVVIAFNFSKSIFTNDEYGCQPSL